MPHKAGPLALATLLPLAGCTTSRDDGFANSGPPTHTSPATASNPSSAGPAADASYTGPRLLGMTTDDFEVTVITDELVYPWEVRIADGTLIVTEVDGNIAMIAPEGGLTRHRVQTSSSVVHDGGSGLMGLALADDFIDSGIAYAYYTYRPGAEAGGDEMLLTNRIVELAFDGNAWTETRVLLDGIPGHQLYNGGRLAIGPDGYLYATTGWLHDDAVAQNPESLAGKILRMDLEGRPAEDNPIVGSYVYSYGHRNPQGLAWDSDGQLWLSDHGESGTDEINQIVPGHNYGWPVIEGDEQQDGMTAPYIHSGDNTWGPSGIAFAGDELVVAALPAQILYVMDDGSGTLQPLFSSGERARAVLPYQDGIYITSTNTSPRATGPSGVADRLLWIRPTD